jgi:hypothetical protein
MINFASSFHRIINKTLSPKFESILFGSLMLAGAVISFLTRNLLNSLPYQLGEETIGIFTAAFFTAIFFTAVGYYNRFTKKLFLKSMLLFIFQLAPYGEILFKEIKPNPKEDFDRYVDYAHNMIENKTLWGGDKLHYKKEGYSYITQPGIRYITALQLLLFKTLYRLISVLNVLFFLCALFLFLKTLHENIQQKELSFLLLLQFLLTVPYAVKNILMGIPEWFTLILLMFSVFFYVTRKNAWIAVFLLALVPFFRQNILPAVLVLLFLFLYHHKHKWKLLLLFAAVLLLPVYHNLYYAGELKFFTSIFQWPFLQYENHQSRSPNGFFFIRIINNMLHYFGFDWIRLKSIDFIEESFAFLWLFCFLFVYSGRFLQNNQKRFFFYVVSVFIIIIPQILLATDFYPRFEFVNIFLIFSFFITLCTIKSPSEFLKIKT